MSLCADRLYILDNITSSLLVEDRSLDDDDYPDYSDCPNRVSRPFNVQPRTANDRPKRKMNEEGPLVPTTTNTSNLTSPPDKCTHFKIL